MTKEEFLRESEEGFGMRNRLLEPWEVEDGWVCVWSEKEGWEGDLFWWWLSNDGEWRNGPYAWDTRREMDDASLANLRDAISEQLVHANKRDGILYPKEDQEA